MRPHKNFDGIDGIDGIKGHPVTVFPKAKQKKHMKKNVKVVMKFPMS